MHMRDIPPWHGTPDDDLEDEADYISDGDDPAEWQPFVDEMNARMPYCPPEPEPEPAGLTPAVYKRLREIRAMAFKSESIVPKSMWINLDAIRRAYRAGELQVEMERKTYWLDGERISGYVGRDVFEESRLMAKALREGKKFYVEEPDMDPRFGDSWAEALAGSMCA